MLLLAQSFVSFIYSFILYYILIYVYIFIYVYILYIHHIYNSGSGVGLNMEKNAYFTHIYILYTFCSPGV